MNSCLFIIDFFENLCFFSVFKHYFCLFTVSSILFDFMFEVIGWGAGAVGGVKWS